MATRIRCTALSTAPCSLREASSCMQAFCASDLLPTDGVMLSYISTVAKALRDGLAMQRKMAKGELMLLSAEERPARVNGVKDGMAACGNGGGSMGQEAGGKLQVVKKPAERGGQAAGEREQNEKNKKRKRRESVEKGLMGGGQEEEKKLEWRTVGTSRVVPDGEVSGEVGKDRPKKRRKERAGVAGVRDVGGMG